MIKLDNEKGLEQLKEVYKDYWNNINEGLCQDPTIIPEMYRDMKIDQDYLRELSKGNGNIAQYDETLCYVRNRLNEKSKLSNNLR